MIRTCLAVSLLCSQVVAATQSGNLIQYVDGYIGTNPWQGSEGTTDSDNGNTLPQVGVPFAHSPLSPQSRATEDKCISPYYYKDSFFHGIRKTHFMSGSCVVEYGPITIIPSVTLDINQALSYHALNHDDEEWTPAYYKITLPESGMVVEASNNNRAGIIHIDVSNAKQDTFYLIAMGFDTMYNKSSLSILSPSSMEFSNPVHRWYQATGKPAGFAGHHHVQFSEEAVSYGIIEGYTAVHPGETEGRSSKQGPVAAYFEFDASQYDRVMASVGSSFVSRDKARLNLLTELGKEEKMFDLERVRALVTAEWESKLSTIRVTPAAATSSDTAETQLTMFYTGLYHSLLLPRIASDSDGEYLSFSVGNRTIMTEEGGYTYMDDFSQWDIYRATLPLQMLVAPDMVPSMVRSLVSKAEQGGWLPIFPAWNSYTNEMIGDHCAVLITDAYLKGILSVEVDTDFAARAYAAMRHNAFDIPSMEDIVQGKGRRGMQSYLENGFIPLDNPVPFAAHDGEQVSRTLEYAYDDYVLAQMADMLGHSDDRDVLLQHSEGYNMVIDAEGVGYCRGRFLNMSWVEEDAAFDPDQQYDWLTEATPYQYSWYVPHQVEKLIQLYKGDSAFVNKLDDFFDGGFYNHGNEPDHQAVFMYAYATGAGSAMGQMQKRVRDIMNNQYSDGPGGLAGNDDCGQTSSWYVMAALGLYQVCPGCGGYSEYVLFAPLFERVSVAVGDDKSFEVVTHRSSDADIFIQSAALNGEPYNCAFIPHQTIVSGGTLEFRMGSIQNTEWGSEGRDCLRRYFEDNV